MSGIDGRVGAESDHVNRSSGVRVRRVNFRRCFKGVVGRRGGNSPLQALRTVPDFLVADRLAGHNGRYHVVQEQDLRSAVNKRADAGHHIEVSKLQSVIRNTARHTRQAHKVLREEGEVEADERNPEMGLAHGLVVHPATPLGQPEVNRRTSC